MPGRTLSDAVRTEVETYADRNPRSAERHERAAKSMPGGNTRSILHFEPFPLAFERGEGAHLWSLDGDRYADFLGEYTAALYGHSEAAILDAVRDALGRGLSFGSVNDLEPRLAELVCARFPSVDLVRFTNSGTEANLMALALAVATTGRRKVLVFRGGYHGGVLTFGDVPSPVTVPHEWVLADYDDVEGTRALLGEHGPGLAAVLVEPMLGSGGCVPASEEFLAMLRAETAACGALLVFDEVMTSRLAPGGLQSVVGVTPDLTTLGKYLGGGLSFGAFGGRADLMAAYDPSRPGSLFHAGTFNNNVASMAAGVATLTEVLTADVLAATNERGDRLRTALDETFRHHGVPMCATGAGSLLNVHGSAGPVRSGRDLAGADDRWRELLYFAALDAGYHLARRGFIALSIEVTDDDVDGFVDVVDRWCADPAG